ncbi:MAG: hypothetical protein KatS3mg057_1070 [Herpetosiphonaceae bacterium]|nr:MAG: hypothetical protein KatS3mg057_1070 [Herpetosiphonaceae bacterium]
MAAYETTTTLTPERALEEARVFFEQAGLRVHSYNPALGVLQMIGGGDQVVVQVSGREPTKIELQTREWDHIVRQLIHRLPH